MITGLKISRGWAGASLSVPWLTVDQMLFRIEKDDSERFMIEKAHFGTEIGDCGRTVDG